MAKHTAPASSLFTDSMQSDDDELHQYAYPWEDEHQVDPLQVAQEELNQQVHSPEDGWHKVHFAAVHKADPIKCDNVPTGFYGDHDDDAIESVAKEGGTTKERWQAIYKQKGFTT